MPHFNQHVSQVLLLLLLLLINTQECSSSEQASSGPPGEPAFPPDGYSLPSSGGLSQETFKSRPCSPNWGPLQGPMCVCGKRGSHNNCLMTPNKASRPRQLAGPDCQVQAEAEGMKMAPCLQSHDQLEVGLKPLSVSSKIKCWTLGWRACLGPAGDLPWSG